MPEFETFVEMIELEIERILGMKECKEGDKGEKMMTAVYVDGQVEGLQKAIELLKEELEGNNA